jgi:hypothetical protein
LGCWPAPLLALSAPAFAQDAKVDAGDTAWMLISTAIVLMMTIPGLALFYGGMVRKKNVLSTLAQSFAITALVSVAWIVIGYSLAFGEGGAYIGDMSKFMLGGIAENWDKPFTLGTGDAAIAFTIPETVFVVFQMTFAIITAALITGAWADRIKFSGLLVFVLLWTCWSTRRSAIGSGTRTAGSSPRRARLRRRHGRSHQCRCRRPGGRADPRQAHGLRDREHVPVQPGLRRHRRLAAVGGLVRLQRRLRRCGRRPCGHGLPGDQHGRRHRGADLDVRGVGDQG